MYAVFGLICIGLLGASLFGTGIIFGITPLVITGICLTALMILGMLILYCCFKKPQSQLQTQTPYPSQNPVAYSSNNMNTMKRNKSDTDLELINRQNDEV
jgi:hypothetical protein